MGDNENDKNSYQNMIVVESIGETFRNSENNNNFYNVDIDDDDEERRRKRRKRLAAIATAEADAAEKHHDNKNNNITQPSDPSWDDNNNNNNMCPVVLVPDEPNLAKDDTAIHVNDDDDDEQKKDDDDDDDDGFDMFSNSVSPLSPEHHHHHHQRGSSAPAAAVVVTATAERGHEQQDWDDVEGYYKAVIGEEIQFLVSSSSTTTATSPSSSSSSLLLAKNNKNDDTTSLLQVRLRVAGVIGKGVFSTVLKCNTVSNTSSVSLPPTLAVKCIRHNESMMKAAHTELEILLKLQGSPGIIPLLLPTSWNSPLEHRGHACMVFTYMEYNLRDVLQKFGKGVGVSISAVRSYFGQLIAAASHLKRHSIIHADLKPDNILVSSDFAMLQLADFGSAYDVQQGDRDAMPTPYMVSRFYRAPEIILGLKPTFAIDLWSLAVSVSELFLGNVLFRGSSNNDMLHVIMQTLGAIPNRVIRQHLVQARKFGLPIHFQQQPGGAYFFSQDTIDPVSGIKVHKLLSLQSLPEYTNSNQQQQQQQRKFPNATPLATQIRKAQSQNDTRAMVEHFIDLLKQCLHLDPTRRIALADALRHGFFSST